MINKKMIDIMINKKMIDKVSPIERFSLQSKTWVPKRFDGILNNFFPVGEQALAPLQGYYGDSFSMTVFFVKSKIVHWYWCKEDMIRLHTGFISHVSKTPGVLQQLVHDWESRVARFESCDQELRAVRLVDLTDEALLSLHAEYYNAYVGQYSLAIGLQDSYSMLESELIQPSFMEELTSALESNEVVEAYALLHSGTHVSFLDQEFCARLKLAEMIWKVPRLKSLFLSEVHLVELMKELREESSVYNLFEEHAEKFFWIRNNYRHTRRLQSAHFARDVRNILRECPPPAVRLRRLERERLTRIEKKRELRSRLALSKRAEIAVNISEAFSYMQDERKRLVYIANDAFQVFRSEIGRRVNLDASHLECAVPPELSTILVEPTRWVSIAKEREEGVVCLQDHDGYEIVAGRDAAKLHDLYLRKIHDKQLGTLFGTSVFPGIVEGEVFCLNSLAEMKDMPQGSILVASMTRPEHIPAILLASAIITSEGGLTSHATVISRERGIPCIVGVEYATDVLATGDRIVMNADKGLITRRERGGL